jgi:hypothetical protein
MHSIGKVAVAAALALCGAAQAGVLQFSGSTAGGPTFNRQLDDLSGPSGSGTSVPYSAYTFSVSTSGFYAVNTAASFDSVSYLYSGGFNPASPGTNALVGQDDLLSARTSGFGLNLSSGVNYTLVTTGFSNSDAGKFSAAIGGAGNIIPASAGSGASPAPEILSVTGNTAAAGQTFNRPLAGGGGLSGEGTAVPYSVLNFAVGAAGLYSVLFTGEFDGFLGLYDGFSATSSLANLLAASDDLGNAFTSGFNANLQTGRWYQLVTTGFSNADFGQYALSIVGEGSIAQLPEPGVLGLTAVGLLAAFARRRRSGEQAKASFA